MTRLRMWLANLISGGVLHEQEVKIERMHGLIQRQEMRIAEEWHGRMNAENAMLRVSR